MTNTRAPQTSTSTIIKHPDSRLTTGGTGIHSVRPQSGVYRGSRASRATPGLAHSACLRFRRRPVYNNQPVGRAGGTGPECIVSVRQADTSRYRSVFQYCAGRSLSRPVAATISQLSIGSTASPATAHFSNLVGQLHRLASIAKFTGVNITHSGGTTSLATIWHSELAARLFAFSDRLFHNGHMTAGDGCGHLPV